MAANREATTGPVERYRLGTISAKTPLDPAELGMPETVAPGAIYGVAVDDPYAERFTAEEKLEVLRQEQEADGFARARREAGEWQRREVMPYYDANSVPQTKVEWGDPVSSERFFEGLLQSPAIDAWRTKIPSAQALADLSDPLGNPTVEDRAGRVFAKDPTAYKWLTLCTDAVAIRNRGAIMAHAVNQFAEGRQDPDNEHLRWMSIACGTALPAMKAALNAGIMPELVLVDLDSSALEHTQRIAREIGFVGTMAQRNDINIFVPQEMARLREELGENGDRPRLIDLMGIFEYTGDNIGVDPVGFLRSNYDMLHPGGRLVFGQMRDDRPVPDFTMGVIRWPFIEMRSPGEFMQVIKDAGIPAEATQLYLPNDGVYTVGVIDKPLEQESFAV